MEYDVFISYSHHDNETHGSWIHEFQKRLTDDYRSRTGQRLKVFFDADGLRTGSVLSDHLKVALENSALFVPVLSPAYLASTWCRREFLHYKGFAGEDIIVEGTSRILPVRLMDWDGFEGEPGEGREEAAVISGFLKTKEILYADFYQYPLPIPVLEEDFRKKVAVLSADVFKALRLVGRREAAVKMTTHRDGPGLFLGYAYGEARKLREQLAKELQQQRKYNKLAIRILPEEAADVPQEPRALAEKDLRGFIQRQIAASDIAVFFYDDVEGAKPSDSPRTPIAHLQYALALEEAAKRADFRIFYRAQTSEDCAASQLTFIEQLDAEAHRNDKVQLLPAFELKAARDFLLEYLKKPALPALPSAAGIRVFYVHHPLDKNDAIWARIDDLMYENKYEVIRPVFPGDDPLIDADGAMRNSWLISQKALVLLRHATPTWCNAKKVELIKTATEKDTPYGMAICVSDPDAAERIRQVRSHEFKIIDCAKDGFEQEILMFLKAASHG
jgi:hypothetical protein